MDLTDKELEDLKANGFPQFTTYRPAVGKITLYKSIKTENIFNPTEEQLADACGNEFQYILEQKDGTFEAVAMKNNERKISVIGATRKQALYFLWRKLNLNEENIIVATPETLPTDTPPADTGINV